MSRSLRDGSLQCRSLYDLRPCGGYAHPQEHAGMANRLLLNRAPETGLYLDDLLIILNEHLNRPRFSFHVSQTRVNQTLRKEAGLCPCVTVVFCENNEYDAFNLVLPIGCIPYTSVKAQATWDEKTLRHKGEMVLGWRPAIKQIAQHGALRPSDELTWLIGQDTVALCPRKYWG